VAYGMRLPFYSLVSFMISKSVCILVKMKFHACYAFDVILYFINGISSWK